MDVGASILQTRIASPAVSLARSQRFTVVAMWGPIAVYAGARYLQVFPGRVPMLAVVALHVIPPAIFALIHGGVCYGIRRILIFFGLCLVIGNIFENVGVLTSFPFGQYYFTDLMGPKLFSVPILLGLAYVGMSYLSWTLARLILEDTRGPLSRSHVVILPLVAGVIMVAWDLSQDPIWSTILHAWIWQRGGVFFGVPVTNFLGWYLAVYLIFQIFAVYLRNHSLTTATLPPRFWQLAVLFYVVAAAGNVLLVIPRAGLRTVSDAAGVQWKVSDITGTCALISVVVMGAFALSAASRLQNQKSNQDS